MSVKRRAEVQEWLAANVRHHRKRRGLVQEDLAEAAGLELRHLQRIEQGNENITIATLIAIADALKVPPGQLFRKAALAPIRRGRPPKKRSQPAKSR